MPRIVVGNCGDTLALTQVRGVLAELSETWPDISIVQRTVGAAQGQGELLDALGAGRVNLAVQRLDGLPLTLPEGLVLSAVGRRLEARTALVARTHQNLQDIPAAARVGALRAHDGTFLRAVRPDLDAEHLSTTTESLLLGVLQGDLSAALVPAADLIGAGHRDRIGALLEPQLMPPPPGQGALGFVVRADDDLAGEVAYTLQHRPSFARVRAERAFAASLSAAPAGTAVGALATVSGDGELSLLGAVAGPNGTPALQAEVRGNASEAEVLGQRLARDVLAQLGSPALRTP